jgi:sec-independent protein translocase protein TatC
VGAPWRQGKPARSLKNQFWIRVFWILVFLGMGAGYTFYFKEEIFNWLLAPAGDHLSPFDGKPVYGSPMGMMGATITVVSKGAILGALPVMVYSVLTMIRPWLPPRFWRFTVWLTLSIMFSYLLGIAFVYYVMLPVGLGFLLSFGSNIAVALIDIGEYLKLLTALMFAMGLVFLIPILMFLLTKMRLVKYRHWRWGRIVVPLFAGFLGIILTPTADGINFLMVSLPVMGLYEVGLFVTWVLDPSDGNYLWLKTIGRLLHKVWRVVAAPFRGVRWVHNKFRDNNKYKEV